MEISEIIDTEFCDRYEKIDNNPKFDYKIYLNRVQLLHINSDFVTDLNISAFGFSFEKYYLYETYYMLKGFFLFNDYKHTTIPIEINKKTSKYKDLFYYEVKFNYILINSDLLAKFIKQVIFNYNLNLNITDKKAKLMSYYGETI